MEFEATYVLTQSQYRILLRLYERRYPETERINLFQSKVYVDTSARDLYETGRSACLTEDRALGLCLLHKSRTEIRGGYAARHELKSAITARSDLRGLMSEIGERLELKLPVVPSLILSSRRRYIVLKTSPQPIMISFDSVDASTPNHKPLFTFWATELECNGETAGNDFQAELRRLTDALCGDAEHISSKYRYALEKTQGKN